MKSLLVHSITNHFSVPGVTQTMGLARSFDVAPVSTIIGFLESLCGWKYGEFAKTGSRLAYGRVTQGHRGTLLRRNHVRFSQAPPGGFGIRPVHIDTLYDAEYRIVVEGSVEERLEAVFRGEVSRFGVLYLGESEDMVDWLKEGTKSTAWLVPGEQMALPVKAGTVKQGMKGYKTIAPCYEMFAFSEPSMDVPTQAWIDPPK